MKIESDEELEARVRAYVATKPWKGWTDEMYEDHVRRVLADNRMVRALVTEDPHYNGGTSAEFDANVVHRCIRMLTEGSHLPELTSVYGLLHYAISEARRDEYDRTAKAVLTEQASLVGPTISGLTRHAVLMGAED